MNFKSKSLSPGYILFTPSYSTKTYLLNKDGRVVHRWRSKHIQSLGFHLLEDGSLLRSCSPDPGRNFFTRGHTGRVEKYDCNGTLIWEFEYRSDRYRLHNDIEPLPNGNILMISWMFMSEEEAISAGCNPKLVHRGELWSDHIIEVEPTGSSGGNIVWVWHVWDHLIQDYDSSKENYGVVGDHPELIDINCEISHPGFGRLFPNLAGSDLFHLNSLDYNEEFDQILVSVRNLNEIWIIDHSTTTEEAANHTGGNSGKGGDLLYRQVLRA